MMVKRYWKIVLALAVIFIAGGGFGFSVGKGAKVEQRRSIQQPENWAPVMMRRMQYGLKLTEEQQEQMRPMLRQSAAELSQIRKRASREQMIVIRDFYMEIEPLLTEDQLQQLEVSRRRVRERAEQLRQQQVQQHREEERKLQLPIRPNAQRSLPLDQPNPERNQSRDDKHPD